MGAEKNTISLCMIVKDEEDNLARCLKSTYSLVDEIIIVDTGSRDKTKQIARSFGALLIEEEWQEDFSEARNISIKNARGEWILILDADEKLPEDTAKKLPELIESKNVTGWLFTIVSPISAPVDSLASHHLNLRMFKNKKDFYFKGRVHENIQPVILKKEPDAIIKNSELSIIHYGYRRDLKGRKKKTSRNIKLLKKELKDNQEDSFVHYNLGNSYFVANKYRCSIEHYRAALARINPEDNFISTLYRNYSCCLFETGNYLEARKIISEGLKYFPDYPDLYYINGQICCDIGLYEEAKRCFKKCLNFIKPVEYVTTEGITDYLSCENLADIYIYENKYNKAILYLERALQKKQLSRINIKLAYCKKNNQGDNGIKEIEKISSDLPYKEQLADIFIKKDNIKTFKELYRAFCLSPHNDRYAILAMKVFVEQIIKLVAEYRDIKLQNINLTDYLTEMASLKKKLILLEKEVISEK